MPTATATAPASTNAGGNAHARPFLQGSWEYSEVVFTDTITVGATAQSKQHNITPGGYLRGITLDVASTGGVIGSGVLSPDAPWSILSNISIESIDGTALYYPLGGYAAYIIERVCRPWDSDPATDPDFSNTINPAFRLRIFLESRATIGVVPNTDARAQYRFLYTVAPSTSWQSTAATTQPTLTITGWLETYAQPPLTDLLGTPFVQVPPGLALQRFVSHQIAPTVSGDATYKTERVGNLIRCQILIFRDNSGDQGGVGLRTDLGGDPIRLRVDNTAILTENRSRRDWCYDQFYSSGTQMATRPTGVYVYPWFTKPGVVGGQSWLETTEATFDQWEINGAPAGGTVEIITEDLVPIDAVPHWMMGL